MTNLPIKKIVFIEPKAPGKHVYTKWGLPRLGMLQLGAILKQAGFEISVFIEDIHGIDFDAVFDADAVGITTITSTAPRAYEMAHQIRKAGIPVFTGGPHCSFMVEEALEHFDYVLRGETEETIQPFLEALMRGDGFETIPGLCWKANDGMQINEMPPHCPDLDKYPYPDFSLMKGTKTFKGDLSITPIMTSRGCPFGCNFCSVTRMFGRGYRFRSVEHVMGELREKHPEWVFFYDDNFAANRAHTKRLLERMIAEGITPKWSAQVRIDVAKDPELLKLMKRAGCQIFYIGLESINPETLKALNKGQTPEQIEAAIHTIHDYGIKIHGMFIFGADNDSAATIRQTVRFAKHIGLATVQFMILTPLPGTPVFEQMEREGRLLSRDWGYYDAHHVVFKPKGMNYLQLQKLTVKAMIRFYSVSQILNRLNRFDLWAMIVRAYGWRMTRQSRKNLRDFMAQLKELYHHAGENIDTARHDLGIRARKTTDDLKEFFHSVNWEHLRRVKEERIQKWRESHGRSTSTPQ